MALVVGSALLLSACDTASNPFAKKDNSDKLPISSEAVDTPGSLRKVDRDVEAPQIFQATDTALWDGRPSLGGVWVASPDAVNPERVILRNEANGKFVIGALFRRERDNPGPKLQISSDAADALGLLAGQPGKISVTALRHEDSETKTLPVADDPTAATPPAKSAVVEAAGDVETAPDPIASADAAIDRAEGADSVGTVEATAAPADDLDPSPQPGETKRQARKRARLAAKAAAAGAAALPTATASDSGDQGTLAAPVAAPLAPLEVVPLPDVDAAAPARAAPTAGSARVQIGLFSVEDNAQRAVDKLKAGGVSATVRKEDSNGKEFWSVVASGAGGSKALLAAVKELGFTDAYAISG